MLGLSFDRSIRYLPRSKSENGKGVLGLGKHATQRSPCIYLLLEQQPRAVMLALLSPAKVH